MTKYVTFFLVAVCLGSPIGRTVSAASPDDGPRTAPSNEQDGGAPHWMTSYYRNPLPDHFVTEVRQMRRRGTLSAPVTVAFLSRVLAQNPAKVPLWMAALADLPDSDKSVLHEAIWLSDTDAGKAYLKDQGLAYLQDRPAPDMLKVEIDSPAMLDVLWGYFFATGDKAPVRRIVSALNYGQPAGATDRRETPKEDRDNKQKANDAAVFTAAVSSLSSFWRKDPRIGELCDGLLKGNELNPTETELLKILLANLNAETDGKNNPSADASAAAPSVEREDAKMERGFGAMLLFSDKPQQFLDDWNTPGATAEVRSSASASRGKPCVAFILFSGCGADQQGMADVVADIRMFSPDGKLLGEQKTVDICRKRPAPAESQMQLGVGDLGMALTSNDPSGTYEIHAKVSDRVKGVVLELKTKFSVDK